MDNRDIIHSEIKSQEQVNVLLVLEEQDTHLLGVEIGSPADRSQQVIDGSL
jgi:hypothetical protein